MKKIITILLMSGWYCSYGQVNLNIGLQAYYPFEGNANDISGNNNNPIFNNATLTSDRFGNANGAYHFNGTDSYMQILNNPAINVGSSLSVCAWVKPMGFYDGACHGNSIVMKGDEDYLPGNYFLRFDDGAYENYSNCSGTPLDVDHQNFYGVEAYVDPPGYTPYIVPGFWHSVIATCDGGIARLYIDCELKAT